MKKIIKVAIVGLGGHFYKSHVEHLLNIKECKIVGVYDLNPEKMEEFDEKYGKGKIKKYKSEGNILKDPAVDAVMIFTPDEHHAKSLYNAVKAGKHVFVEKPIATSTDELKLLVEALDMAERKKLVITSCHPRRFNPPYVWLKKNIHKYAKEFGKILSVKMHFSYQKSDTTNKHMGLLMDHINHEIDYVHFLLGPASFKATRLRDSVDLYEVNGLRIEDQVSFSFLGVRRLENEFYNESVEVIYEKGVVKLYTSINPNEVEINNLSGELDHLGQFVGKVEICRHEDMRSKIFFIKGTDYKKSFLRVNKNFIDTILGVKENYLTFIDLFLNTVTSVKLTEEEVFVHELYDRNTHDQNHPNNLLLSVLDHISWIDSLP